MMPMTTVSRCGASAVRVVGTSGDRERDWKLVHQVARRASAAESLGVLDCIPTYDSVLVEFDATRTDLATITAAIESFIAEADPDSPLNETPRHFDVPVVYGGEFGPDLEEVARIVGLDADEVIRRHTSPLYVIRCLGAPGGSPMLDGPDFPVAPPRLASARTHVPAGKVSVAGRQATITPAAGPGGWQLIGATPLGLFDLRREPPVPYRPGDTLSFHRIEAAEFARLEGTALTAEEGAR